MMRWMAALAALLLPASAAAQTAPQVGDTHEITHHRESAMKSANGSGSIDDTWVVQERVLAVRPDGIELEYDHPAGTSRQDRASDWSFPARVFKPVHGPLRLLNAAELEARIDPWLKSGDMTRAMCGRMIFTWNAFRIECDPQAVLKVVESYELGGAGLSDGARYSDAAALEPGVVHQSAGPAGAIFTVELVADPEVVRRERADLDVSLAQLSGEQLTHDEALRKRSGEEVSGTIAIRFEADKAGNIVRRTRVTTLHFKGATTLWEAETTTETLERRRVRTRGKRASDPGGNWT